MNYFDQIQDVMIRSGQLVMSSFRKDIEIFRKQDGSFVTNVDIENENFLKKELAMICPEAGFIAEESGFDSEQSDFVWVIDPLDGTKNFIHGIPHFCIMVALTFKNEPIVSAIYQPITQDLYYAQKGQGAWLNGSIRLKLRDLLFVKKSAIVVVDDSYLQCVLSKKSIQEALQNVSVSNRYFGSAGIDACYMATGSIDYIRFDSIAWWDVAAGMLLISEVQGLVCRYDKSVTKKGFGTFFAGHDWLYQQILTIIDCKVCN